MEELKQLKYKRNSIKGQITRLKTYIANLEDSSNVDTLVYEQLEVRLARIEPLWDLFVETQYQIEIATEEDESQSTTERENFETLYFNTVARAKMLLTNYNCEDSNQNVVPNSSELDTHKLMNVKLPQINMPIFSGAYEHWAEFYDTFNSLINSNPSLNQIQKFCYLRSALKGEPSHVISSLEVSADNYMTAWQLLKERYENKKIIINNHVKALFNLPTIQKESHTALRQLLDDLSKHLRELENLGEPVAHWSTLVIYILVSKFDHVTRREWESQESDDAPSLDAIRKFLKRRCEILEALTTSQYTNQNKFASKGKTQTLLATSYSCVICKGTHNPYNCEVFTKLEVNDRIIEAKKLKLCLNCLKPNHFARNCRSTPCRKCNRKHSTLLHIDSDTQNDSIQKFDEKSQSTSKQDTHVSLSAQARHKMQSDQVLLSTACIHISDSKGKIHICRALLDSGSQSNFVTESLCSRLGLKKENISSIVYGISNNASSIKHRTEIEIHAIHNKFSTTIPCLVIPNISDNIPLASFESSSLDIPQNLILADPSFNNSGEIELLIGSALFWQLLCVGQIKLGSDKPILQKTRLGWIIAGPMAVANQQTRSTLNYFIHGGNTTLEEQVSRFWTLEECSSTSKLSKEEQEVEDLFVKTTTRDPSGRFIVTIPKRENIVKLGESRLIAQRRFYNLEKKLVNNPELRADYIAFMHEYEQLGHMTKIDEKLSELKQHCYLPHHPVVKDCSLTTRVRVVFDASCKTSTNLSLNDVQKIGPVVQDDLLNIIIRFRCHTYVITADVTKMYRQILLKKSDRSLHRIFWRTDPSHELDCFELNTITYGTASAAYLATRCLKQLANDNQERYPKASEVINHDFYVDDLLSGAESINEIQQIYREVSNILQSAGFPLRKWLSNQPSIFHDDKNNNVNDTHQFGREDAETKTLGVIWNSKADMLTYRIGATTQRVVSKRTILAITAQIFDPLGLLGPITINAKMMLQRLWQHKLTWDESIPLELNTKWLKFHDHLQELNSIEVPRNVLIKDAQTLELHGFADASEGAYGACIYIRSIDSMGRIESNLLCAKSRVAPLKNVTLPRLELCAALLLANLANKILEALRSTISMCKYWSDSTITLSWIKGPPSKWKTFVANRVSEIQSLTDTENWMHVDTKENPADLISRGVTPSQLCHSELWWHGPSWLSKDSALWETKHHQIIEDLPETRQNIVSFIAQTKQCELFLRYSSVTRLQRVVAYLMRFVSNARKPRYQRLDGNLTVNELQNALLIIIKIAQNEVYSNEVACLNNKVAIHVRSKLLCLNPFLDTNNVLRVGGRLQLSKFTYDKIHPIILPPQHILTKLIALKEHQKLLHCGAQALLASLREIYWIPNGRNLAKSIVHRCVTCFKVKPRQSQFLMGSLPESRISTSYPFQNTGTDYAGPILIRDKRSRGYKLTKAYIALFVCFSTKAIHIEVVTSLTADSFIAALRRFVARRGKPQTIYSDNGTNFVGANKQLNELSQFLEAEEIKNDIINTLSNDNITWHFIPPRSPHFGGLWEAGVKAIKAHMLRVIGNAYLTYEELSTVLTQIEAILNSRPLCPLTSDLSDLNPLTPAHFLIGRRMTALPDAGVLHIEENRLSLYQRLQGITQHFWKRWSREYIPQLQTRCKWKTTSPTLLQIGALVIIKEENIPPLQWKLGRVAELHPGHDGIVRVISVQCSNGLFKRAVSKICVLPVETKDNND